MSDKLNLTDTLAKQENCSTFSRLLAASGAGEWLTLTDQFTVFAPTNGAFAKIPDAKVAELLDEPGHKTLKMLLSYHFMPGKLHSEDLTANPRKSITGDELTFDDSNGLHVNGAAIQESNLQASNGVIHQIDTVLAPPMKTAIKPSGALERAKTVSAAPTTEPIERPPAIGSPTRKSSTIF